MSKSSYSTELRGHYKQAIRELKALIQFVDFHFVGNELFLFGYNESDLKEVGKGDIPHLIKDLEDKGIT